MDVDLCYILSHGFAARMVLHSDLLSELQMQGLRMAIIAPNAGEAGMRALAERHGVEVVQAPVVASRFRSEYERLRRYLFEDVRRNPALWAKHLRDLDTGATQRQLLARLYLALNRICQRAPAVREAMRQVELRMVASEQVAEVLRQVQPGLLVSTYPVSPLEASFLYEARRQGIATVGQLLSWDNITCKGRFSAVPDYFIAWGPIMADELRAYYGVLEDRITECGVAHFDVHSQVPEPAVQAATLLELGLHPERPYLFFGMSSPYFAPHEIDIVEWLARAVWENVFGTEMQLVVRPHPQNVQGHMADLSWLPRLQALEDGRVAVDYPSVEKSSSLAWSMKERDLAHLATLLHSCAVSLNSGSTLSIDAILHDRPVVLTTFDAGQKLPWWRSARRVVEYPHLAKLIDIGGVQVVRSFEELRTAIRAYLDDPLRDAEGRAITRQQECGSSDGHASRRIAEALAALAPSGRTSSQRPMEDPRGFAYG